MKDSNADDMPKTDNGQTGTGLWGTMDPIRILGV